MRDNIERSDTRPELCRGQARILFDKAINGEDLKLSMPAYSNAIDRFYRMILPFSS